MTDYIHVSAGGEVSFIPGDCIVTCDEETASWIGNDADSMRLLVRCRDCKFASELVNGMYDCQGELTESWDYYNDEPKQNQVPPDGFCAWGEPREESC